MSNFPPDHKQPSFLFPIILLLVLIASIIGCFFFFKPKPSKPVTLSTEDMPAVQYVTKRIVLEFADTVNGRPTFNVLLSDTTGLDSMYPEEIAKSLITGKWDYDEDLKVQ